MRERVAAEVSELRAGGVEPGLATVLVGEDPASEVYVRMKRKACAEVGIESFHHPLAAGASQEEVATLLASLNADAAVSGILLQLPLPAGLDAGELTAAIDPGKDVDGLTPVNAGLLAQGGAGLVPCTPAGVMELLADAGVELRGAAAVVIGRSQLVGRPLAQLLLAADATVTQCHSRTRDLGHRLPERRRARGCGGATRHGHRRHGPRGRGGDRRGHQSHGRRAGRRRGLRARRRARGRDHPGARRRGAHDDRDAAFEHRSGRAAGRRPQSRHAGVGCLRMDLRRLRAGEWMAGGAGVALLVSLFLPWYSPGEVTAWQAFSVIDLLLAALAAAAIALVPITASQRTPSVAIAYEALLTLAAMVGVLIVLLRVIDLPGADGRSGGLWLGAGSRGRAGGRRAGGHARRAPQRSPRRPPTPPASRCPHLRRSRRSPAPPPDPASR